MQVWSDNQSLCIYHRGTRQHRVIVSSLLKTGHELDDRQDTGVLQASRYSQGRFPDADPGPARYPSPSHDPSQLTSKATKASPMPGGSCAGPRGDGLGSSHAVRLPYFFSSSPRMSSFWSLYSSCRL